LNDAVSIWHSLAEPLEKRDFNRVLSFVDPACEWRLVTSGKSYRGHDEIRTFMTRGWAGAVEREKPDVVAEFGSDGWGLFEYVSRGRLSKDAVKFVSEIDKTKNPVVRLVRRLFVQLASPFLVGKSFEVPVCFIYHVNEKGLIDRVHEYAATAHLLRRRSRG
jgi:hypothetical protein